MGIKPARKGLVSAFGLLLLASASFTPAMAEEGVMAPGDAVVTGFSGLKNIPKPSPLDGFFIDPEGPSMQILPIGVSEIPQGQHLDSAAKFSVKAGDVGQVFAITLEKPLNSEPNVPPNIFLGASSAFGLQLVRPDNDGDGHPERIKKGHAQAQWMEGQFGTGLGGEPGSIYRVDGVSGAVSLFATIPDNHGPGLGDLVFDKRSRQFFASDLDTGLIHRIGEDGSLIDTFDHGVAGHASAGLPQIPDNGEELDITNPAFNTENSDTWGLTQDVRRIWGMAVSGGRLYYSVWKGPQVWSVGINEDGSFADDARKEFDVEAAPKAYPISDMVFDARGRLFVAQRGGLQSSYDYSVFAKSKDSNVLRFERNPDGTWTDAPDNYAVGFAPDHKNASGGVDLGFNLKTPETGFATTDASLWSTGDALRDDPALDEPRIVHGLQGNNSALVRPQNVPPTQSVFVDYDGKFNDPQASGHVGDVEIWQPGESLEQYGEYVPIIEPDDYEFDVPWDDYTPDDGEPDYNLTLEKVADPKNCHAGWLGGWECWFTITVTNTGTTDYAGPITVRDWLPAAPAGTLMNFKFQPVPWTCNPPTPSAGTDFECTHAPVLLHPGESVELKAGMLLPPSYPKKANGCRIRNNAAIVWPFGFGDEDPLDDMDSDIADIPSDECQDEPGTDSNLILEKFGAANCWLAGGKYQCLYSIIVTNDGPADFSGTLKVKDVAPAGTTLAGWSGTWNCNPGNGNCTFIGGANIANGANIPLLVRLEVPIASAKALNCKVKNKAGIKTPVGGTSKNTKSNDDKDWAIANVPQEVCDDNVDLSNLKITKKKLPDACMSLVDHWCGYWEIKVINTGPETFHGKIKVKDLLPVGVMLSTTDASWSCNANGVCETNNAVTLNPSPPSGDKKTLKVMVQGDKISAQEVDCKYTNKVKITKPLGGTKNYSAVDDKAQATTNLPPILCNGPKVKKSNLKIKKTLLPDLCLSLADHWCGYWRITIKNTGPGKFNDKIKLKDQFPAGVSLSTSHPKWTCSANGSCETNSKVKLKGSGFINRRTHLKVMVQGDKPAAKAMSCKFTNKVKIVKPAVGHKNTKGSDDKAEATQNLPGILCDVKPNFPGGPGDLNSPDNADGAPDDQGQPDDFGQPGKKKSNLRLKKKADPSHCSSVAQGVKCTWVIRVHNDGPGNFSGKIELNEMLPAEPVDATWNGSWTCEGVGGGPGAICKHPVTGINKGGFLQLTLNTIFSKAQVKRAGCSLSNFVEIAKPVAGSSKNTEAGDDTAQATASAPKRICNADDFAPPPPVGCPPGYALLDGQCMQTHSTCPRGWSKTPVAGKCCPPGKPWNGKFCQTDTVTPATPTPSCPAPWKLFKGNQSIPQGWQIYVVDVINGQGWRCAKPQPSTGVASCPSGYKQFPSSKRIPNGWTKRIVRKGKSVAYCGKAPVSTSAASCPTGYKKFPSSKRIPKGWTKRIIRKGKSVAYCGKAPVSTSAASCPKGYKKFPSSKRIPKGWTKRIIRKGKSVAYCGKAPVSTGVASCPSGYRKFPSAGRIPKGWSRRTVRKGKSVAYCGKAPVFQTLCTGGRVKVGKRCVCPRNTRWNGKFCNRVVNNTGSITRPNKIKRPVKKQIFQLKKQQKKRIVR